MDQLEVLYRGLCDSSMEVENIGLRVCTEQNRNIMDMCSDGVWFSRVVIPYQWTTVAACCEAQVGHPFGCSSNAPSVSDCPVDMTVVHFPTHCTSPHHITLHHLPHDTKLHSTIPPSQSTPHYTTRMSTNSQFWA